eukprot:5277296-Pyramimonas_sp.AAC.1
MAGRRTAASTTPSPVERASGRARRGPDWPSRADGQIAKDPCHYSLVLTVRPDETASSCDVAAQTSGPGGGQGQAGCTAGQTPPRPA